MNEMKHHLTDALLMGYSAGNLPEAFSLVVATHISMCDECRSRMASFDAVGGELLMAAGTSEMREGSLDAVMAIIAGASPDPLPSPTRRNINRTFPEPLQSYVNCDIGDVKWRKIGGGVSQLVLSTSGDATVRLLHIPGGVAVPDHGHRGTELTLVLQGAFSDETDRFNVGDIEVANEDLDHQPVAEPGVDCICLAATDAPLKFSGLVPRIAQKFVGI
jgi:putative transcriptional regulator